MNTSDFIKKTLSQSEMMTNVVMACRELLNSSAAQQTNEYLSSRVSNNSQKKFDFGYFPDEENLHLLVDKVGFTTLKSLGLAYRDNTNPALIRGLLSKHNMIMPIKDDYGNIVALVGRTSLSEEEQKSLEVQKYKYTNGYRKSGNLFGLYNAKKSIRRSKHVILVEGQIDCVTCHSYGFHNTVALGGSSMSDYQMYLLMKHGKDLTLNLLLDNDEAGQKAKKKIADKFGSYIKIRKVNLPNEYKDIDQYLRNSGNHDTLNQLF